ncbi:MAG: hypothetical protein COA79_01670 [Planctomycetota bacterium]|nr:MAG: hypothetical protein COA79_01670 [Planctomycetota bacterium]
MNLEEFKKSVEDKQKPDGINILLTSLWEERVGNWDKAHNISQDEKTEDSALIHAYLHRREGDESNAKYWYNRANSSMPEYDMDEEWLCLVKKFL